MAFKQHHCWFLVPAWGHLTSANALIYSSLKANPALVVTVVHHGTIYTDATWIKVEKVSADLGRMPGLPKDRLNIISVGDPNMDLKAGPHAMANMLQQYAAGWLDTLRTVTAEGQPWPKPTACLLDTYGSYMFLSETRKIVGPACKVFMHWTGCATTMYALVAPSKDSGMSDYAEVVEKYMNDETLRKGRDRDEMLGAVCIAKNGTDAICGKVLRVPGMKDMYDYEREASNGPTPPQLASMLGMMSDLARETDGLVEASSMAIEGAALEATKKYQTVYPVGIQLSPRGWNKGSAFLEDEELRAFLDKQAPKSALFISFGSMFFPNTGEGPRHLDLLINILIEQKFPFVFALGGMLAQNGLSSEQVDRINSSGVGIVRNEWVDQQAFLQHPSTGWFLTHGGWNGMVEALAQGVPMIAWPLAQSDQATNAAIISTRDKPVGFEFLQIRQGYARAPPMRGGPTPTGSDEDFRAECLDILDKARGKEGEAARRNVEEVAEQLRVERDGKAAEVLREFASI